VEGLNKRANGREHVGSVSTTLIGLSQSDGIDRSFGLVLATAIIAALVAAFIAALVIVVAALAAIVVALVVIVVALIIVVEFIIAFDGVIIELIEVLGNNEIAWRGIGFGQCRNTGDGNAADENRYSEDRRFHESHPSSDAPFRPHASQAQMVILCPDTRLASFKEP
jgi:hypothetical protein